MSNSYILHIRPKDHTNSSQLLADITRISGKEFAPDDFKGEPMASSDLGRIYLSTGDARLDDLDGIPLSRYPWYVMMDEFKQAEMDQKIVEFLLQLFDGLDATGRYGCWLVYQLTDIIATNDRDAAP